MQHKHAWLPGKVLSYERAKEIGVTGLLQQKHLNSFDSTRGCVY